MLKVPGASGGSGVLAMLCGHFWRKSHLWQTAVLGVKFFKSICSLALEIIFSASAICASFLRVLTFCP
jgi:hypothetical protein